MAENENMIYTDNMDLYNDTGSLIGNIAERTADKMFNFILIFVLIDSAWSQFNWIQFVETIQMSFGNITAKYLVSIGQKRITHTLK